MRRKGTNEELAIIRKQGLGLLAAGKKPEEVAELLKVTARCVYRWRQESKKAKQKQVAQSVGRPRKLTEKQIKKLEAALDQGAYAFGYVGDYWTLDRIAQVIWQLFKVRYHPSGVWHIMDRLGWSSQRPQRLALHRDDKSVVAWQTEGQPEVKKDSYVERHAGAYR